MTWSLRIDGDMVCYMAGFAADSRGGGVANSLHNTKLIIDSLIQKFYPCKALVFLTSREAKDNFRTQIYPEYKQNRSKRCKSCSSNDLDHIGICSNQDTGAIYRGFKCQRCGQIVKDSKPVYYAEIRKYMIKKYGAYVVRWGEADDWLGVKADKHTIIASGDKDLLMVPAWHWRIKAQEGIKVTDPGTLGIDIKEYGGVRTKKLVGYGFKWFCAQMLQGDSVDNIIKPVKGFGPMKIYGLLSDTQDPKEMWQRVKQFYLDNGRTQDDILLAARLLWIAREPKQVFDESIVETIKCSQE